MFNFLILPFQWQLSQFCLWFTFNYLLLLNLRFHFLWDRFCMFIMEVYNQWRLILGLEWTQVTKIVCFMFSSQVFLKNSIRKRCHWHELWLFTMKTNSIIQCKYILYSHNVNEYKVVAICTMVQRHSLCRKKNMHCTNIWSNYCLS